MPSLTTYGPEAVDLAALRDVTDGEIEAETPTGDGALVVVRGVHRAIDPGLPGRTVLDHDGDPREVNGGATMDRLAERLAVEIVAGTTDPDMAAYRTLPRRFSEDAGGEEYRSVAVLRVESDG